jgi:hypothetical protein
MHKDLGPGPGPGGQKKKKIRTRSSMPGIEPVIPDNICDVFIQLGGRCNMHDLHLLPLTVLQPGYVFLSNMKQVYKNRGSLNENPSHNVPGRSRTDAFPRQFPNFCLLAGGDQLRSTRQGLIFPCAKLTNKEKGPRTRMCSRSR